MELRGRTVLISGAARRVGAAIAERLARSGCNIALHFHRSAKDAEATAAECRASGAVVELIQADLRRPSEVERVVPAAIERFGGLDILINNASTFERMSLGDFDLARWNETLQVNLTAPAMLAHAAANALRTAHGRIVNLCDVSTARPWPTHLAYSISKAGLETLTRALAREFAPNVNVVGVAPGVAAWPDDYGAEQRDRLIAKIPLRRAGSPADIASAIEFVLRDGDYMTGVIIPVDGGRSIT